MIMIHDLTESIGGSSCACTVPGGVSLSLWSVITVGVSTQGGGAPGTPPTLTLDVDRNSVNLYRQYYREITGSKPGESYEDFRFGVYIYRDLAPEVGSYAVNVGVTTNGDSIWRRIIRNYLLFNAEYVGLGGNASTGTENSQVYTGPNYGALQLGGALAVSDNIHEGIAYDTVTTTISVSDNVSIGFDETLDSYFRRAGAPSHSDTPYTGTLYLGTRVYWSPSTQYAHTTVKLASKGVHVPLGMMG